MFSLNGPALDWVGLAKAQGVAAARAATTPESHPPILGRNAEQGTVSD